MGLFDSNGCALKYHIWYLLNILGVVRAFKILRTVVTDDMHKPHPNAK